MATLKEKEREKKKCKGRNDARIGDIATIIPILPVSLPEDVDQPLVPQPNHNCILLSPKVIYNYKQV